MSGRGASRNTATPISRHFGAARARGIRIVECRELERRTRSWFLRHRRMSKTAPRIEHVAGLLPGCRFAAHGVHSIDRKHRKDPVAAITHAIAYDSGAPAIQRSPRTSRQEWVPFVRSITSIWRERPDRIQAAAGYVPASRKRITRLARAAHGMPIHAGCSLFVTNRS